MVEDIINIVNQFDIDGELIDYQSKINGNINKTYLVSFKMKSGEIKKFIIQRINTTVFKEPFKVMKNVSNVTKWFKEKSLFIGDEKHQFLEVIPTKNGGNLSIILDEDGEKQYYRAYNYIENSTSYDSTKDKNVIYNAGKAFGHFQKMLIDYPIKAIEDTIEDFHNTAKRYEKFLKDVEIDACGRVKEVFSDIDFVIKNSRCSSLITDLINNGKIKESVIHGDTKVNNVMFDQESGEFLTVIDLDTIMRGTFLYDYGDGVRSAAANAFEDEKNLDKVYLNDKLFESYTDGYLSEISAYLSENEVLYMGTAIEVITFELGLRFLNDYINGDTYFKTTIEKHNLIRARNQFKLLMDIKSKKSYINDFIMDCYKDNVKRLRLK